MTKLPETASQKMLREIDETVKRATSVGGFSSGVDKTIQDAMGTRRLLEEAIGGGTIGRALRDIHASNQIGAMTRSIAEQAVLDQERLLRHAASIAFSASSALAPPKPSPPPTLTSAADLAPLIRAARKRMGMNQQQFADAAGVGRRFLSELENGKPSLEFDKVIACALAAGIDILAKPRLPL